MSAMSVGAREDSSEQDVVPGAGGGDIVVVAEGALLEGGGCGIAEMKRSTPGGSARSSTTGPPQGGLELADVIHDVGRSAAVESGPSPSGLMPLIDIGLIMLHYTHLPYRSSATARGPSRFQMIPFCFAYSTTIR
jgi:hypothetical protein